MSVYDLTWMNLVDPDDAIQDIAQKTWEINGEVGEIKIKLEKRHFRQMARKYAREMNGDKDIFDGRTKGGKFLKHWEKTFREDNKHIYETEVGIVELLL